LEAAIESYRKHSGEEEPKLTFDVRWRPFQLNPSLPTGQGLDKMQYYYDRFGMPRVDGMIQQMKAVGRDVGIDFSYGGHVGNTFDSHRMIWFAQQQQEDGDGGELQDQIVEELFRAYFTQEKSLGEHGVLKECAANVGLDVSDILAGGSSVGTREVQEEMEAYARRWNCRGVPLFVIDDKYPLNGAQPSEAFLEVFGDIEEEN